MSRSVVISTERVNCYGTRVITDGIDTTQYERNPVLMYMHRRGTLPIGRVEKLRKEDGCLIGELVFDETDPESKKIADKWDNNFLRMVSPCLEIMKTSSDDATEGQSRQTVSESKLIEVSVVDIGGNDDALALILVSGAKLMELSRTDCEAQLPPLCSNNNKLNMSIYLELGLPATATEEEAKAEIVRLKKERDTARKELELTKITAAVDAAIAEGKIEATRRDKFIELGKKQGEKNLTEVLELMSPVSQARPTDITGRQQAKQAVNLKWDEMTEKEIIDLRATDPKGYAKLYKETFGFELIEN